MVMKTPRLLLLCYAVVAVLLSLVDMRHAFATPPQSGPIDDVRNGWYPQLPPVSQAQAEDRAACVQRALGTPARIQMVSEPLVNPVVGGPALAPAELTWEFADGRRWRSTAALTALFPAITYVEAARHLGVTPNPSFNCPEMNGAAAVISLQRSPIGPPRDCPDGTGACFQAWGDAEDPLREGAVYTQPDGTRLQKRRGGFAFFGYHYWRVL